MLTPDNNLAVKSNDFIAESRNQQYDRIITELSTKQFRSIPLFSEATTQVLRLTESPVSILSLVGDRGCQIGAIGGLDLLYNLPTNADLRSELAGIEYCHHQTMICDRSFIISNFHEHPELNTTALFRVHGIRSYVGVPIITAAGDRLGTISILDFIPHQFSNRDIDLLQLVSRWLASEFERKFLSQAQLDRRIEDLYASSEIPLCEQNKSGLDDNSGERLLVLNEAVRETSASAEVRQRLAVTEHIQHIEKEPIYLPKQLSPKRELPLTYSQIKTEIQFKLIVHLAQKLRTPLTSILGMASVLQQEIYGPLTIKQKDYLGIIHSSGQKLVSIIDEIAQLFAFDAEVSALANRKQQQIDLKPVDLKMLCQRSIQNLEPLLQQKQQQMVLDFPESNCLWLLNKDNVRQIIYYLSLSLIQGSGTHYQISIELADLSDAQNERLHQQLQLQITTTDPHPTLLDRFTTTKRRSKPSFSQSMDNEMGQDLRVGLGLSLSYTLASLHGGNIELMPNRRGYLLSLPTTSKTAA
jgi:signal transduction histidine kinase